MNTDLEPQVREILPAMIAFRRELHARPELSFQEYQTSRRVREELARLPGIRLLDPFIGTDVVAVLEGPQAGRCLVLRADMDALPITEQTGAAYASTTPGVMHACGHDGHTAMLLGAATVLARTGRPLPGRVVFVFQPAEEDGGGGGRLCARGLLESLKADAALALHAWPNLPVGTIGIRSGEAMAANFELGIRIRGRGSHGAYPHRGIDPVVVAAQVISALQTIVSRNIDPQDPAVVTVGCVRAGQASNVIPDTCDMSGTIRFVRPETGARLREAVERVVRHTALAHGAEAEVTIRDSYPPMYNAPELAGLVVETGRAVLGEQAVFTDLAISMGVEDFAFYARRVPAAMFRLGIRPPDRESFPSLHQSDFDFNDDALATGIVMLCELARRFLERR